MASYIKPNKLDVDFHTYGRMGYLEIGDWELPVVTIIISAVSLIYIFLHPRIKPPRKEWTGE